MWTEEKVATLRKLWAEGHSARVISDQIGLTRNAVIGKADRLKLDARRTLVRRVQVQRGGRPRTPVAKITKTDAPPSFNPPVRIRRRNQPEMTKGELRRMFELAWSNTAKTQ